MAANNTIDAVAPGPLYQRIEKDLAQEIEDGLYRSRSLPSTRELCQRYGVSAITVREALNHLEQRGLVARRQGRNAVAVLRARPAQKHPVVAMSLMLGHHPDEADYWAPLLLGANSVLQKACRVSCIVDEGSGVGDAESYARKLKRDGYEGVLLRERFAAPWGRERVLDALRSEGIHSVLLDGRAERSEHAYVCTDFARAGWVAAKHLWDLGHRRIAYCSPEPDISLIQDRYDGFESFLASVGGARDSAWFKGDSAGAAAFLKSRRDITAAFVVHDKYAREVLHELCHHQGWKVPGELAVVSCDDSHYASDPHVQLTSIHQQFYQMGAIGAEILLSIMDGRQGEPMPHVLLQPHLMVRNSSGAQ